jgi:hypothetical protein
MKRYYRYGGFIMNTEEKFELVPVNPENQDCEEEEEEFENPDLDDIEFIAPRERVGVEAYSQWNEQAFQMWWLEEGRW